MEGDQTAFICNSCGSPDLKVAGISAGRTVIRCASCGHAALLADSQREGQLLHLDRDAELSSSTAQDARH